MSRPDRTTFNIWQDEIKAIGVDITNADDGTDFLPDGALVSFYKADDDSVVASNLTALVDDNTISVMVPSGVYSTIGDYYAIWRITKVVNTTTYVHRHPSDIKVRSMKPSE